MHGLDHVFLGSNSNLHQLEKESVQILVVAFQPSRPPWREGSRLLPKRVPAMALVCGRRSGSRVTWMPKFNRRFLWWKSPGKPNRWNLNESSQFEKEHHLNWTETMTLGSFYSPFLPSRIMVEWKNGGMFVSSPPDPWASYIYLRWSHKINSINVGKYIPTSPMDPISGPLGHCLSLKQWEEE